MKPHHVNSHGVLLAFLIIICNAPSISAKKKTSAIFLGNSYTAYNNLPQLVHDIALSAGDTLVYDSYTPGGYQLINHSNDPTSQNKIASSSWDYIVLQGQSQEPIMRSGDFYGGMNSLYNLIRQHNSCNVLMPYMTWGRKNGDQTNCPSFPVMCTYLGMDTTLRDRYLNAAANVNGEVSPVSVVWRHIRTNHPGIELYAGDGSHPSRAGSYAAACTFYASIFKEDPTKVTFDFGLSAADASAIKNAAKTVVFDNLSDWDFKRKAHADFKYTIGSGNNEVDFVIRTPQFIRQRYSWNFGDGDTSDLSAPTHPYASNGTYTVTLTTTNCDLQGTYTSTKDTVIEFCSHTPTITTSKPWLCRYDTLWTQPADSYQWFVNDTPIPETGRSIPNYRRYSPMGFSVKTTVNGCTELSQVSTLRAESPAFYFDALGNPCEGDTVAFAVLHINGSLPGTEVIQWYMDNSLIPNSANRDTLLINSGGKYECVVSDPASNCPKDTISYAIEYNCGPADTTDTSGSQDPTQVIEFAQPNSWTAYPNPTSGNITIDFEGDMTQKTLEVFSIYGELVGQFSSFERTEIDISNLRSGIYYLRVKGGTLPPIKVLKR